MADTDPNFRGTNGPGEVSSVIPDATVTSEKAAANESTEGKVTSSETAAAVAAPPGPVVSEQVPAVEKKEGAEDNKQDTTKPTSNIEQLWTFSKDINHPEIWGVTLTDPNNHVPTQIILQKYLNANDGDLTKAKDQLKKTLEWRAKTKPLELIEKKYSKDKFGGLGFVTKYADASQTGPEGREIFTWNVYGNVKDINSSFGDLDAFIEWRVALMELAMKELDLANATEPITEEHDPYKIYQVHDYKTVGFFRSPPAVRSAAKKTAEILAMAYPETLKEKFFVNVPAIMGFMYGVMKMFVAPKTVKKFHPMSNGGGLALEFTDSKVKGLGEKLPKEYGGKGEDLDTTGKGPILAE